MPWRTLSLLLAIVSVAYVAVAGILASGGVGWGWACLFLFPVLLGVAWWKTTPPPRGEDWVDPAIRSAMRACCWGGALLVAARTAPAGRPAFDAVANLGAGAASIASLVALSRVTPLGGLLVTPRAARRLDAAGFAALLWTVATALPAARALLSERTVQVDPLAIDYASAVAGAGSLLITMAAAFRVRVERRLELGVADRANAALGAGAAALAIAAPAALLRLAPADRALPMASLVAATAVGAACLRREPTSVARGQRITLAITVMTAPAGLFLAALAVELPQSGALLTIVAIGSGVLIGFVSRAVARPLGPEQSRWIDAIEASSRAALHADPDLALRAALSALREAAGGSAPPPELWRVTPAEVLTVDRAGYLQTDSGTVPPGLFALAELEPERTLRTEVLETLEVRRADVRPLLEWMRSRNAMSVTLLTDEEGTTGLLLLPTGTRATPMTLEEVRAVGTLADRLSALLGVSSSLARSRLRELAANERADRQEDQTIHLQHLVAAGSERHDAAARRLARAARIANFSPAARLTIEELERLGAMAIPVTLLTPVGVDPIPYAALVHLASARKQMPLVIVDGADAAEQALSRWTDPAYSPLALAQCGTLFVDGAAALPDDTQQFLARSLAERRSPGGGSAPLDVAIVVAVPATIDTLVASGRLSPSLADRFGDRAIPLPPLMARSEDLRALVLDRLARLGLKLRGRPFGVDSGALGRLIEHTWPGNDLELDDVMARATLATLAAGTDLVTGTELDRIGFVALPPDTTRRSSSRPSTPATPARRRIQGFRS